MAFLTIVLAQYVESTSAGLYKKINRPLLRRNWNQVDSVLLRDLVKCGSAGTFHPLFELAMG